MQEMKGYKELIKQENLSSYNPADEESHCVTILQNQHGESQSMLTLCIDRWLFNPLMDEDILYLINTLSNVYFYFLEMFF